MRATSPGRWQVSVARKRAPTVNPGTVSHSRACRRARGLYSRFSPFSNRMKFRSLLDLILRPIPAAETPEAVRARRTGDYVVAAILGLFVLAGLYWGLHRQITTNSPRSAA